MRQPWPLEVIVERDTAAETEMRWVIDFIMAVRQIRGEMDIAPSRRIDVLVVNASTDDLARIERTRHWLERLATLSTLTPLATGAAEPESAVALLGDLKILLPMAGLIDVEAETARLEKRIAKLNQELTKTHAKLQNSSFVANAPPAVVEQERARLADFENERAQLAAQLIKVAQLQQ
jgi:valyl-tRNA synthetase